MTLEEAKYLEPGDVVMPLIGENEGKAQLFIRVTRDGYVETRGYDDKNKHFFGEYFRPSHVMEAKDFIEQKCAVARNSAAGDTNDLAPPTKDAVNHPSHYTDGQIEVIDFIEDKRLNFHRGCAVKYIARAGKKNPDKEVEDLQKAVWYLNREISHLMAAKGNGE